LGQTKTFEKKKETLCQREEAEKLIRGSDSKNVQVLEYQYKLF